MKPNFKEVLLFIICFILNHKYREDGKVILYDTDDEQLKETKIYRCRRCNRLKDDFDEIKII